MEHENTSNSRQENRGMALAGLILSIIGLICACLDNWRTIGVVIAFVGLVVSWFSMFKMKHTGVNRRNALFGIIVGLVAILIGGYFLYERSNHDNEEERQMPVPIELKDTAAHESDHVNALEKLQGITDSSSTK